MAFFSPAATVILLVLMAREGNSMFRRNSGKSLVANSDPCEGDDWHIDPDFHIDQWAKCFGRLLDTRILESGVADVFTKYFAQRKTDTNTKVENIKKYLDLSRYRILNEIVGKARTIICGKVQWTTDPNYPIDQWAECFVTYFMNNYGNDNMEQQLTGYYTSYTSRNTEDRTKKIKILENFDSFNVDGKEQNKEMRTALLNIISSSGKN